MAADLDPELMDQDPDRIRHMFADIAPRYDLTNTLLTGSTDAIWRNRTAADLTAELRRRIREGVLHSPPYILDTCAGTGKLGRRILHHLNRNGRVCAADFCVPLLKEGSFSFENGRGMLPVAADALRLPVPDDTFDAASIAFGYRNLEDRAEGLRELHRVLRPGGVLAILEFHIPERPLFRTVYLFFFNHLLPVLGSWISGSTTNAYRYLTESVRAFPNPPELKREFRENGYSVLRHRPMMMGAVHLYLLSTR